MKYLSTRGDTTPRGFSDILLEGLAPDGGLYLPTHYPQVDDATLARWRGLSYADLAFEILSLYIDDIPAADLKALVHRTYTREVFGTDAIVPLRRVEDGIHIEALKLWRKRLRYRSVPRPPDRPATAGSGSGTPGCPVSTDRPSTLHQNRIPEGLPR